MPELKDQYMTPAEVATRLHRCDNTVWRWLREGKLRAVKVGRTYLITEASVTEIMHETIPADRAVAEFGATVKMSIGMGGGEAS